MRTLWLKRQGSRPPYSEIGRPQGKRSKGVHNLETGHDLHETQNLVRLPLLPHRNTCRATDTNAVITGSGIYGVTTGEPCAWKLASTVRGGADGKGHATGRSQEPKNP